MKEQDHKQAEWCLGYSPCKVRDIYTNPNLQEPCLTFCVPGPHPSTTEKVSTSQLKLKGREGIDFGAVETLCLREMRGKG